MRWFNGSVEIAIQTCRRNSALLVVFVESADENGKKMSELWNGIDEAVFGCPMVALRLTEGSAAHGQFAAVYATPVVPVSYLINLKGIPIEAITLVNELTGDQLSDKVAKAVQSFKSSLVGGGDSTVAPTGVVPPAVQPPTGSIPADVIASQTSSSSQQADLDEKVKRAKILLEQKRAAEAEKKRLEEQEKEIKRRDEAKSMQRAQEERRNRELIEAAEKRRRDKIEDLKEKKRLLEQIKADREEREERLRRNAAPAAESTSKEEPAIEPMRPVPSDHCRIQAKFPDGSLLVHEFPSSEPLNTLKEVIRQDPRVNGASFRLAQAFPRRVFTDEEAAQSYLELCLTPASTVLVVMKQTAQSKAIATANNGLWSLFSLFFYPFQLLLSVFGFSKKTDGGKKATAGTTGPTAQQPGPSTSSSANAAQPRRPGLPRESEIRRRGNVSSLHNDEHSDAEKTDDEGNWNGNSTQYI